MSDDRWAKFPPLEPSAAPNGRDSAQGKCGDGGRGEPTATERSESASDPSSDAPTSSAESGGGTVVECAACGHVGEPVGRGQCGQCRAFVKHNVAGMIHGGRRERPLANPEDSELYQGWAADLGGDLTAGQRVVLRRAAEADAVCQSALDYVLHTRESLVASRVQKALAVLVAHSTTVFRAANLLGLERKAHPVSVTEYVERKAAEARQEAE